MKKESVEIIRDALEVMELPVFISMKDLKQKYKYLAKYYHPDICKDKEKMVKINQAYEILKNYMTNFKFTFSDEEIHKQFPEDAHASKFRF